MSSEYGAAAGRIGVVVVIKGSVQMRKQRESSALLLSESKVRRCRGAVAFGRGSTSRLETRLWPCHLGQASKDAGLCWRSLAGLCGGKGAGLAGTHAARLGQRPASGWTVTPVRLGPGCGSDAGGHGGDRISTRALGAALLRQESCGKTHRPLGPQALTVTWPNDAARCSLTPTL